MRRISYIVDWNMPDSVHIADPDVHTCRGYGSMAQATSTLHANSSTLVEQLTTQYDLTPQFKFRLGYPCHTFNIATDTPHTKIHIAKFE